MRVLWITNDLFPEAISLLTGKECESKSSGGWLLSLSEMLSSDPTIELFISSVSPLVKSVTLLIGEKIHYYVIPLGKGNMSYNHEYEQYWKIINNKVQPDIVHLHGTEYTHGMAYVRACGKKNLVVSIQGVVSEIAKNYTEGLRWKDIALNLTMRDILKGSIIKQKRSFERRAENEQMLLRSVDYVFGRTSFDFSFVQSINPTLHYYHLDECLRKCFYDGSWQFKNCLQHSVFISQAHYPIKGLHFFLKALPLVISKYSDCQVYIGGTNIVRKGMPLTSRLKIGGYGRILNSIMRKNGLENHIHFTGNLNAEAIKRMLLMCNLYVCPSTCENSPNSLCEAQMLGVPCVASNVGGIPDLINDPQCGMLYKCNDIANLAEMIIEAFDGSQQFDNSHMKSVAHTRHNKDIILKQLLTSYHDIIKGKN